jgi:hypothetical protein
MVRLFLKTRFTKKTMDLKIADKALDTFGSL